MPKTFVDSTLEILDKFITRSSIRTEKGVDPKTPEPRFADKRKRLREISDVMQLESSVHDDLEKRFLKSLSAEQRAAYDTYMDDTKNPFEIRKRNFLSTLADKQKEEYRLVEETDGSIDHFLK